MTEEKKSLSRSEREAKIKDKAGWVITVLAALLAINTLLGGSNSSKILNTTIEINNTWAFYQSKDIKSRLSEMAAMDAEERKQFDKAKKERARVARYESEPETGEGKKELLVKARKLEAERIEAKQRSPWYTYAGSAFQIAIVLLTASILAVQMTLFWASLGVGSFGLLMFLNAHYLFFNL